MVGFVCHNLPVRTLSNRIKALLSATSPRSDIEMLQKGYVAPLFSKRTSLSRPPSLESELSDTEFEDDSDVDEYAGRRSEESVRRNAYREMFAS